MKTSTEIGSAARRIGEERAIEIYAKAGFDAWDFSLHHALSFNWETHVFNPSTHPFVGKDHVHFARHLRQIGEDNGICCNQSHAPFPTHLVGIDMLKRAIECTAEAGGKICVIHPQNNSPAAVNAAMYRELLPTAREFGVKIATENMWNWVDGSPHATFAACATPESFLEHLDLVNDPDFVVCLDVGHAEMRGLGTSAVEMIHKLGCHLQALHLHDNNLMNDSHGLPFTMQIDFEAIVRALKEENYAGYFTLEADSHLKNFDDDTIAVGMQQMADATRKLATMFEAL